MPYSVTPETPTEVPAEAPAEPEATPEATPEFPADQPAPEAPSAPVELKDFTMPEGVAMDPDLGSKLKELATKHGWSQEVAQEVANLGAGLLQKQQAAFAEVRNKWVADAKADPEIGGEKFEANLGRANQALDLFATREYVEFLRTSGLGNHPEEIRAWMKVADAIGEDRLVNGLPPSNPTPKPMEEVMFPSMVKEA